MNIRFLDQIPFAGSFWRTVPPKSVALFILGVFFFFSAWGFVLEVLVWGGTPVFGLLAGVLFYGLAAAMYPLVAWLALRHSSGSRTTRGFTSPFSAWPAMRLSVFLLLIGTQAVTVNFFRPRLFAFFSHFPASHSESAAVGVACAAMMALGYVCQQRFIRAEGARYFRDHTEIMLAHEIHKLLVPRIDRKLGEFEIYGGSLPSGEVGGDLVDCADAPDGWMAYIADVSGHGVASGVVVGMVKSAARMWLLAQDAKASLLERLHEVIYPVKQEDMFVTFAYLARRGERFEFATAGHPPGLHFRAATRDIVELQSPNPPLGLFLEQTFTASSWDCSPGDVLVLVTDGLLEVTDKAGREFGLENVKAVLRQHADGPLGELFARVFEAAKQHGPQQDDQSLLLIRRR